MEYNWEVTTTAKMDCCLGIKDDSYGWFEMYDVESGGEWLYIEGGIWFTNKSVTDYDGCFDLPIPIREKLTELGYSLNEI